MTTLGVALIGCGFQGTIHGRNIVDSASAELVVCADVDGERAAQVASSFGVARSTSSIDEIWEDPAVDAAVIATTTHTHHQLGLAAIESGKHMLIEKPLALTVEECLELEEACAQSDLIAVVGYKFRFTTAAIAAREGVAAPTVLTAHTLYDPAPVGSHGWVNDRALSGGRLVSSLVHSVDLLRYLARDEVVRVYAEGSTIEGFDPAEPTTATATMYFGGGAIGSIVHGTAGESGLVSTWSFQAAAPGVNATIHDHGRRLVLHRNGQEDESVVDPADEPFAAGTAGLFEAFVSRVSGENVDAPGLRDGTISLHISRCIEESIATGQPVSVPPL